MAETAESTGTEQVQEQQGEQQQEAPDVSEAIKNLQASVDELKTRGQEEPQGTDDLFDFLTNDEEWQDEEQTGQEEQPQAEQQGEMSQEEADAQALAAYIQQQAAAVADQRMGEYMSQQETARRQQALDQLSREIPDINEDKYLEPIREQLWALAERTGNESVITDPELVKTTFYAIKAQEAAAAEKERTEQAADGASLETAAGASNQGADEEAETRRKIMGANKGGNIL